MVSIDLNVDCGESFGIWTLGDDEGVLPHVTSANLACGGHAGDPLVMQRTVQRCKALGVAVGAHPGYPDLQGFGRRALPLTPAEVGPMVLAQIGALYAIARSEGVELRHVKAHGALYNRAAVDPALAEAIARAVAAFSRDLILVGLANSCLTAAGEAVGLRVAHEAFADRGYQSDRTLVPRGQPGDLIHDPAANLAQALRIVTSGQVQSVSGELVKLRADTLCLHGDTVGAAARALALRQGLIEAGVTVQAL
ncbi:MAG: LamB/YcsF family protein [Oscillochloridaceae bacterium umkhey_bin13]